MTIPHYPATKPLEMSDKPLLDTLCADSQPHISELTFAGLYLFRNAHHYQLATVAGAIVVCGTGYDGADYFLPPLGGNTAEALEIMFSHGLTLYGADEQLIATLHSTNNLQIIELRDSFDYLYLRDELALLPGSRFHKKINRINYLTRRHTYTVSLYSPEHLDGCLTLLDKWYDISRDDTRKSIRLEVAATSEALHHAAELDLEGVVIIVDDHVAAFSLGERLNQDTAVCHFEKADPFLEGLYQLVNREFARLLFQECRYINREQDLGDMGLRNAKLSYHPVDLVKKHSITGIDNKDFVALNKIM